MRAPCDAARPSATVRGLRVFASTTVKPSNVPHGWATIGGPDGPEIAPVAEEAPPIDVPVIPPHVEEELDDMRGNVAPAVEPKRRAKKTAKAPEAQPAEKPKRARKAPVKNEEPRAKSARAPKRRSS